MIWFLRFLCLAVFLSMLGVTTWASWNGSLFEIPSEVAGHPWFIATLVDAYWAFIFFYLWVAWKERTLAARVLWLFAILLLGNLAMAVYAFRELCSIRSVDELGGLLARRNPGFLGVPSTLLGLSVVAYALA